MEHGVEKFSEFIGCLLKLASDHRSEHRGYIHVYDSLDVGGVRILEGRTESYREGKGHGTLFCGESHTFRGDTFGHAEAYLSHRSSVDGDGVFAEAYVSEFLAHFGWQLVKPAFE